MGRALDRKPPSAFVGVPPAHHPERVIMLMTSRAEVRITPAEAMALIRELEAAVRATAPEAVPVPQSPAPRIARTTLPLCVYCCVNRTPHTHGFCLRCLAKLREGRS